MKNHRPDWDSYFMEIARIVSKRSTCIRRNVGSLIVKDKRILSTGYNGAPIHLRHCIDAGCMRERLNIASGERHELCRGLHAEQNAIIQAAYHGVSINGADVYSTHLPCSICMKMIINAGIEKVLYADGYPDELSLELIDESGILVKKVNLNGDSPKSGDVRSSVGRNSKLLSKKA
ncbi:MAG: dCMP deaminase [Deltaproteobacteria bacterium]|jgi:dCMP deaminase|nr:dCMP deaminase [Deltaproteobacteria bacterium]